MSLTLPSQAPAELTLPGGLLIEWESPEKPVLIGAPVQCAIYDHDAEFLALGAGQGIADSFLGALVELQDHDAVFPAEVALALDELGHQAVRIVCQRLSGGELESAVFAEAGN